MGNPTRIALAAVLLSASLVLVVVVVITKDLGLVLGGLILLVTMWLAIITCLILVETGLTWAAALITTWVVTAVMACIITSIIHKFSFCLLAFSCQSLALLLLHGCYLARKRITNRQRDPGP